MAQEREFIRETLQITYTPNAPSSKRLAPPVIRPESLANILGIVRTLPRTVRDTARAEAPLFRVFDARYGYLMKHNLPLSKAVVATVAPKASPRVAAQPPRASKSDDVPPGQPGASSPCKYESKYRPRGARLRRRLVRRASQTIPVDVRAVVLAHKIRAQRIALCTRRLAKGGSSRGAPI